MYTFKRQLKNLSKFTKQYLQILVNLINGILVINKTIWHEMKYYYLVY